MRLSEDERRLLSDLENALEVCECTDTVEVTYSQTGKSNQSRIIANLVDVLSISCGLLVSPTVLFYSVLFCSVLSALIYLVLFCSVLLSTIALSPSFLLLQWLRYF